MSQQMQQVLILAKDWVEDSQPASETLLINKQIAVHLAQKNIKVFCTVPFFQHELTEKYTDKTADARRHGVVLIGAEDRGRDEEPEVAWITEYWRDYYQTHLGVNGMNEGRFSHIIGYVPDTYHTALEIRNEYHDDSLDSNMKVILIVTDVDKHSTTDNEITAATDNEITTADEVYVLGSKLFDEYHEINHKFQKLMPLCASQDDVNFDVSTVRCDGLQDNTRDIKIVTVWPTYIQFQFMEEVDRIDLTTTGRAINHFAKHMATKTNQRVRWEIRGVPNKCSKDMQSLFASDDFAHAHIIVSNDLIGYNAQKYSLYVSPLSRHYFDPHCLEAMQKAIAVLVDSRSGLGEYLSRSNLVLDSVVTDNVVVKCQGKSSDDVMNWGQALDAFLSTAGKYASDVAHTLRGYTDPNWIRMTNSIVADATPVYSGRAMNDDVMMDQQKELARIDLSRQEAATVAAAAAAVDLPPPVEESALLCRKPWSEVFDEAQLSLMAQTLTSKLFQLGKQLGLREAEIERFRNDNPHCSATAVSSMLCKFKYGSKFYGQPQQCQQFVDALVAVGERQLAMQVAGVTTDSNAPAHGVTSSTRAPAAKQDWKYDFQKPMVKQWTDMTKLGELRRDEKIYKMTSRPRGYCMIVNIMTAHAHLEARVGSDVDVNVMSNVFTQLHFIVKRHVDLQAKQLKRELEKMAENTRDLRSHDCFVLFLMAHGVKDEIYCSDGVRVKIKDLIEIIENCAALKAKPKLFFIQACRPESEEVDRSGDVVPDAAMSSALGTRNSHDTFIAHSTVDGTLSYRHTSHGSWYIQALAECLCRWACEKNIIDIMKEVRRMVVAKEEEGVYDRSVGAYVSLYQCPQATDQMCKHFYFYPGH